MREKAAKLTNIVVIPVVWLLSINRECVLTGADVHCMLTSLQAIVLSMSFFLHVTAYKGVEVGCTLLLHCIPIHTAAYSLTSIHRLFFVIYVMNCMYTNCCDALYLECGVIIPW